MKSNIIFFDSLENTKRGALRWLVIFPIFIVLTFLWFLLTKKPLYDKHIDNVSISRYIVALIISSLLISSAVGVHNPNNAITAVTYAGLVGLVVYGITNVALLATSNKWGYTVSVIDTLWGVVNTSFLGYILYIFVNKFSNTLAPV